MTDEIHELLVSDIVEKYRPVYPTDGGDWQDTVEYLYANERERMEQLFESIKVGGFQEPITLSEDNDADPRVNNGTHRVAAALYHGLVTLPARYGYLEYDPKQRYLRATIELRDAASVDRDEDDLLIDTLCSWPLDNKTWITADLISGSASGWEIYFDQTDLALASKIKKKIIKILGDKLPIYDFKVTMSHKATGED
jgi:hypothetical protein